MAVINAYGMKDSDGNTVKFRDDSGGGGSANSVRATYDTSPTTNSYSEGDYIYYNDTLYVAKTSITAGTALVVDTNIKDPDLPSDTIVSIDGLPGSGGGGGVTANDVSFDNTTSGLPATEVQTAIDVIDAEVDDIVNVYGSKNLFLVKAPSQAVVEGVTFTQNSDGSITITGTPNNPFGYPIANGDNWDNYDIEWLKDLNGKTLEISGVTNYAESGMYFAIVIYNAENQALSLWSTAESSQHTAVCNTNGAVYYRAWMNVDDTTKNYNVTVYPMLRLASIHDSTYKPYSMTNQQITKRLSGQSNRNLMDNPWFTINQRGFTSATIAVGYTVDRWFYERSNDGSGHSCEYTSSGMYLSRGTGSYALIAQKLEDELISSLIGKTVTLSLMTSTGLIYSGTWVFDGSDHVAIISPQGSFFADYYSYQKDIRIVCNGTKAPTFRAVKLELGSESTLAYDVAPDYAEELAKCQRYYIRNDSDTLNGYSNNTYFQLLFSTPVKMRANPAVTFTGALKKLWIPGELDDITNIDSTGIASSCGVIVSGTHTTSVLGPVSSAFQGYFEFSAEL